MKLVMTNGFSELSVNEMEAVNGGTDKNQSVYDLFYLIGQGAGNAKNFIYDTAYAWAERHPADHTIRVRPN